MRLLSLMSTAALGAVSFAFPVSADWTLQPDQSVLTYVSTKNGDIAEVNRFTALSGSVTDAGAATVTVDLASVDTGIDIRNERVRKFLFDVANFAGAEISAALDMEAVQTAVPVGGSMDLDFSADIALHGETLPVTVDARISRVADDTVRVSTLAPVLVTAYDFGLDAGIETLREIAGLETISASVPVTFDLVFVRD